MWHNFWLYEPKEDKMKEVRLEGLTTFKNGELVYDRTQEKINELREIMKRMSQGDSVERETWDEYPMYWEEGYEWISFWIDLEHPLILKNIQEDDIVLKKGRVSFEKQSDPEFVEDGLAMARFEVQFGRYPESLKKIDTVMKISFWPDAMPTG